MLASFLLFFVDILFSKEEEYLNKRHFVKYLRNLRVLILAFYGIFHTDQLLRVTLYTFRSQIYVQIYG